MVHAFEPLPSALENLRSRGLRMHVHLHQCALANRRGTEAFVHARGASEESGFRVKAYNQPEMVQLETIEVSVCLLDDFIEQLEGLHFIKVDAEGAEVGCLIPSERVQEWRSEVSIGDGGGTKAVDASRAELAALRNSPSWKLTRPFRTMMRALQRL